MTTKIWITRTQPDATSSAENWRSAGFDPVIAPLLTVSPIQSNYTIPDEAELIFTSANGARYCGLHGDSRRVYAVGTATAKAVRALGFVNIVTGGKDWRKLLQVIEKIEKPIIHISGSLVQGRLLETLTERGYAASRRDVYRTDPIKHWPLDAREIRAVALYSPRAAQTLVDLPEQDLSHVTAYCLSENVAAPLAGSDLTVRIAASPNEMSLIACSHAPDR